MKIRNFAFFGVMAAILSVSGANAVETTRQLATKAYVDNKAADANYRSNAAYEANTIGRAIKDLSTTVSGLDGTAYTAGDGIDITNHAISASGITTTEIADDAAIAKTQLATDVQTSLGKADTALQAHQDISGKQDKTDSTPASAGTYITNTNAVGSNLTALDTALNTLAGTVSGLDGTAYTAGDGIDITNHAISASGITTTEIADDAAIAKTQLATDVQTSLGKADTALQAHQDISGKQDKTDSTPASAGTYITNTNAVGSNLTALDTALNTLAGTVSGLDGTAYTAGSGIDITNHAVSASGITNTNIAAAGTANIAYGKMETGLIGLDIETSPDCSTTNPCMLTYVGNNTYKWTNMIETTDETLTAVQQ